MWKQDQQPILLPHLDKTLMLAARGFHANQHPSQQGMPPFCSLRPSGCPGLQIPLPSWQGMMGPGVQPPKGSRLEYTSLRRKRRKELGKQEVASKLERPGISSRQGRWDGQGPLHHLPFATPELGGHRPEWPFLSWGATMPGSAPQAVWRQPSVCGLRNSGSDQHPGQPQSSCVGPVCTAQTLSVSPQNCPSPSGFQASTGRLCQAGLSAACGQKTEQQVRDTSTDPVLGSRARSLYTWQEALVPGCWERAPGEQGDPSPSGLVNQETPRPSSASRLTLLLGRRRGPS